MAYGPSIVGGPVLLGARDLGVNSEILLRLPGNAFKSYGQVNFFWISRENIQKS